jgi:DNA-binding transcriptional LysR family regulator
MRRSTRLRNWPARNAAAQNRQRVGDGPDEQLPAILKELRKQHPAAEIAVTSGTSEVLVDQILAGEVDVAFVSLPVDVRGIKTETTEPGPTGGDRFAATQTREANDDQRLHARGRAFDSR